MSAGAIPARQRVEEGVLALLLDSPRGSLPYPEVERTLGDALIPVLRGEPRSLGGMRALIRRACARLVRLGMIEHRDGILALTDGGREALRFWHPAEPGRKTGA